METYSLSDTYFSLPCAQSFAANFYSFFGAIMAYRHKVPSHFKTTEDVEVKSIKAQYDLSNKILLLSVIQKLNKNVLMMSSLHSFMYYRTLPFHLLTATKNLQLPQIKISNMEELTSLTTTEKNSVV